MARADRKTLLLLNEAMATAYPGYSESLTPPDLVRLSREQPHPQDLLAAHCPELGGAQPALQAVSRVPHRSLRCRSNREPSTCLVWFELWLRPR
jgi:hypothetical protein